MGYFILKDKAYEVNFLHIQNCLVNQQIFFYCDSHGLLEYNIPLNNNYD